MPNFTGLWTPTQQLQARALNIWPATPGAPTSVVATAGDTSASVAFTAPADIGFPAGGITGYTVTSSPGGLTATGASSPLTVVGLTNNTAYTFTVRATNATGTGPASSASSSVTPEAPSYIEDVFSTYLYTGTGAAQTITNGIDISGSGGMVWIKGRDAAYFNNLTDTARGAGALIYSNSTLAQAGPSAGNDVTSFNSNGFSLGTDANGNLNTSTKTFVSWTFRKKAKFFDIVTYTGNGVSGRTVAHNLGSVPGAIFIKGTSDTNGWSGMVRASDTTYASFLSLNTDATSAYTGVLGDPPTSTQFTTNSLGNSAGSYTPNVNGVTYVAYLFAHNAGGFGLTGNDNVISCGSYTGTGSALNVTLGYEPQWVLVKRTSGGTGEWALFDNMRGMYVGGDNDSWLYPNTSAAESTGADQMDPTATGFTVTSTGTRLNNNGSTYVYIAIRRGPMKVPTVGTSVYNADTTVTATTPAAVSGFVTDLMISTNRTNKGSYSQNFWTNRLNYNNFMSTTLTDVESGGSAFGAWDTMNGSGTAILQSAVVSDMAWMFKRAPGFMDMVCYTGNGGSQTITHNLKTTPQLIIMKNRSNTGAWGVYFYDGIVEAGALLNSSNAATIGGLAFGAGSTGFTVYNSAFPMNNSVNGNKYIAYLFATCTGVSKVGSYTGTGTTKQIDCGFTSGARFVLIKRINSSGEWYLWDSARGIISGNDPYSLLNSTAAEESTTDYIDPYSAGFELSSSAPLPINGSGDTFIFLAIA